MGLASLFVVEHYHLLVSLECWGPATLRYSRISLTRLVYSFFRADPYAVQASPSLVFLLL